MLRTEGPRAPSRASRLPVWVLVCALLLPAAAAADDPVTASVDSLSSFIALQAQNDLKELGRDIVLHLSGKKAASLPDLERRLGAIEARLSAGAMLESEAAQVREGIQRLSTLLTNTKVLAAGPDGQVTAKVQQLVSQAAGKPKGDELEAVSVLISGLRDVAAKPDEAAAIFDNLGRRLGGDPKLAASLKLSNFGPSREAVLTAVTGRPVAIEYTQADLVKKVTDLKTEQIPAPSEPGQPVTPSAEVKKAAALAGNPFMSLLPDARERKFKDGRASKREELLSQGRDALRASGESPESYQSLAALVARLNAVRERMNQHLGFQGPAQSFEEEQSRLEAMAKVNQPLALYLVYLSRYRVFMRDALMADAIPDGLPLEAWELGQPDAPGASITFHVEREGGQSYSGFLYSFQDGTSRFQGQSIGDDTALVVVRTPATGKTARSVITFNEKKEVAAAHTRVIDEKTKRLVREELADIARKLTTVRSWDDAGTMTQEVVENQGVRSLKDFNNGLLIEDTGNKQARISALPGQGKGPAQFKYQYGTINEDGSISINKVVLHNGTTLLILGRHVTKILDAAGKLVGYEVNLADLAKLPRGSARTEASRALAREILEAVKFKDPDGAYSVALGNLLRDMDEYSPSGSAGVRLSIDENNAIRLIYEMRDGTRRLISGQFLRGSAFQGKTAKASLIISGPIEVDAQNNATQERSGYWREYTSDDTRLEWTSRLRSIDKGWGPWSHTDTLRDVFLVQQSYDGYRWRSKGEDLKKTLTEQEGKTWFGEATAAVMKTPVLGDTLDFCGKVGKTVYTGLVGAPQILITAVSGSDMYSIEAGGSYANNPLMNLMVDDQGHIDRLTSGAREELYAKVRSERRKALQSQPYPVPPDVMAQAVNAPISAKEAADVLRNNYGAGSYGKRLIAEGQQSTGLSKVLLTAGGVLTGAFEGIAESMFNPLVIATFGLGQAVAALNAAKGIAQAGFAMRTAISALTITHKLVTGVMVGTFLLNAADDVGKTVEAAVERKFDEKFYNQLSATGTDLLFLGLMIKGLRDQRAQERAHKLSQEQSAQLDALEAKVKGAAQPAADVKAPAEVKTDVKALVDPNAGQTAKVDAKALETPKGEVKAPEAPKTASEPTHPRNMTAAQELADVRGVWQSLKQRFWGKGETVVEKAKVTADVLGETGQAKLQAADIKPGEGGPNFKMTSADAVPKGSPLEGKAVTPEVKLAGVDVKSGPVELKSSPNLTQTTKGGPGILGPDGKPILAEGQVRNPGARILDPQGRPMGEPAARTTKVELLNSSGRPIRGPAPELVKGEFGPNGAPRVKQPVRIVQGEFGPNGAPRVKQPVRIVEGEFGPNGVPRVKQPAKIVQGEFGPDGQPRVKAGETKARLSFLEEKAAKPVETKTSARVTEKPAAPETVKTEPAAKKGLWQAFREEFGRRASLNPKFSEVLAYGKVLPYNRLQPAAFPKDKPIRVPEPPEDRNAPVFEDEKVPELDERKPGDDKEPALPDEKEEKQPSERKTADSQAPVDSAGQVNADNTRSAAGGFNGDDSGARGAAPGDEKQRGGNAPGDVKSPGGGGGGGGGGGSSAGGGGGSSGGGGPSAQTETSKPASGPSSDPGPDPMSPAAPAGVSAKAAPDLIAARPKPLMTPRSAPAVEGGHAAAPSLGRRFDGTPDRPRQAEAKPSAAIMSASGASQGLGGLPAFNPKAPVFKRKSEETAPQPSEERRERPAREVRAASMLVQQPAAAKPASEDYSYTYLPSAQQSYEFPKERAQAKDDSGLRSLADLGLRASAAASIGYLLLYSNLPFILGLSRKKRRE